MARSGTRQASATSQSDAKNGTIASAPSEPARDQSRPAGPFRGSRQLFQQRMGQAALAAMRLPRYAKVSVSDLASLLLAPLSADRISFAEDDDGKAGSEGPIGMAIWASVSPKVASKLAEQANAGVFPVKLERDEWASGDDVWLLDLLVPTRSAGTAIFMNFGKLIGDRPFRVHPVVLQSVDRTIVEKFRSLASGDGDKLLTH